MTDVLNIWRKSAILLYWRSFTKASVATKYNIKRRNLGIPDTHKTEKLLKLNKNSLQDLIKMSFDNHLYENQSKMLKVC